MQREAIRMKFISPLHLGRGREELDKTELIYHSDSLKSAIYAVGLPLFPEWNNAGKFFKGFSISSCFPYARKEYFFPKPLLQKRFVFSDNSSPERISKKAKKIRFLSKSLFEQFLNCREDVLVIDEEKITSDHLFACEYRETCHESDKSGKETRISFFKEDVQQRVAISIESAEEPARPFYFERIYFEKDCGLFFLAVFHDPDLKEPVLHALNVLGKNGIGTDRTVGNGLFEVELPGEDPSFFEFTTNQCDNLQIPLGLFLPEESEIQQVDLPESSWELVKRGGFISGSEQESIIHLRKKSIYMFAEGSVFKSGTRLKGKFTDLRPEWNPPLHPVYRCGMPVFIYI